MYSDPLGLERDWLDRSVDFSAGVSDSLSFNATHYVRGLLGVNEAVDEESTAYFAGEVTESVVEIVVTLGASSGKVGAKIAVKVSAKLTKEAAEKLAKELAEKALKEAAELAEEQAAKSAGKQTSRIIEETAEMHAKRMAKEGAEKAGKEGAEQCGKKAATRQPLNNADFVKEVARRAEAWGTRNGLKAAGGGSLHGTKKHAYAKRFIDRYQRSVLQRGLRTKVSYLRGVLSRYGAKNSVRFDVIDDIAMVAYDFKFTLQPMLSARRIAQLLRGGPSWLRGVSAVGP